MTPTGSAAIYLHKGDDAMLRPAAMVWNTPDGFAWLEPAYLDAEPPPRPAFHRVVVESRNEMDNGFVTKGPRWGSVVVAWKIGDDIARDIVPPMRAYQERLRELGTTLEAERARMTEELAEQLV